MARGSAGGGYRSALRSRDLRLLLGSQLVSSSGSWAYNVALLVLLYERTHSPAWVAAGALGRFVPALVFSAYGGVVAERFERVRLMVWVNVAAFALQAGLAVAAWLTAPVLAVVALAALTSVVSTAYAPAVAAVIPQVVPEDDLAAANALNATVENVVVVAGPAFGAVLLVVGGPALAIAVNALTFAVAAAVLPVMRVRSQPADVTRGGQAGPLRQVADGFRALAASPPVVTFVAFSVLASFVYGTDTVLCIQVSRLQLHLGTSGYGYLFAGMGAGGVVGAVVVSRLAKRTRLAAAILGGITAYCLPTAILVVVHQPVVGILLEVIRGAGTLVVDTLAITALQRSAPRDMVARVFGVYFALVLGAISLGALLTPVLLHTGLHPTMIIYGVGIPVLCLLALPRLVSADRVAAARVAMIAPRVAVLERLGLFVTAPRPSLENLAAAAEETTIPPGTVVIAEGEDADAFYAVTAGSLAVSAAGEARAAPARVRTLGAGTYFGEIGLLAHVPRTATVTAETECTLLRIGGGDFLDALTSLSASQSLLEGARTRLARTHPSSQALAAVSGPLEADGAGAPSDTPAMEP